MKFQWSLKIWFGELSKPLLHLYTTVNNLHAFPISWNEGLIISMHKRGDKCNTDNYRGIVISSCVGQIYLKVLTMRIENHMASSGLWKFNQCGFKKDHRTEDNLFVLNMVYESHVVNKNEKSYVAFVDFTKYFDLINRTFLLYKLLKYGITGPIYYVINSMYSATKYSARIHDKKSQFPCQHLVSNRAAQWAQYCLIYTKMFCMISSMTHAIRSNLVKFLSVVCRGRMICCCYQQVSLAYKDV